MTGGQLDDLWWWSLVILWFCDTQNTRWGTLNEIKHGTMTTRGQNYLYCQGLQGYWILYIEYWWKLLITNVCIHSMWLHCVTWYPGLELDCTYLSEFFFPFLYYHSLCGKLIYWHQSCNVRFLLPARRHLTCHLSAVLNVLYVFLSNHRVVLNRSILHTYHLFSQ